MSIPISIVTDRYIIEHPTLFSEKGHNVANIFMLDMLKLCITNGQMKGASRQARDRWNGVSRQTRIEVLAISNQIAGELSYVKEGGGHFVVSIRFYNVFPHICPFFTIGDHFDLKGVLLK